MNSSDVDSSFYQSSDILYDYPCGPCDKKDISKEATCYCFQCSKLFCQSCSGTHGRTHKKHTLLSKKDVSKWGPSRRTIRGDTCPQHVGHVITWYCEPHDSVCCPMCVSAEHKSCNPIKDLSEVAKGIKQRSDFRQIPTDINEAKANLNQNKRDKKQQRQSLKEDCKRIVQSIKDVRKRVEQNMADLEKDTIDKTEKLVETLDASLEEDEDAFEKVEAQLQQCIDDYKANATRFESSAFASYRACKRKLADTESLIRNMPADPVKIKFDLDKGIGEMLTLLGKASVIGQCLVERTSETVSDAKGGTDKPRIINRRSSEMVETVYTLQKTNTHGLKMKDEAGSFACGIYGLCVLPNGSILAVDNMNHRVKQLDPRFVVTSHLGLPLSPQDVCYVSDYQVAITAGEQIYFLSAKSGEVKMNRTVSLGHSALGIAYHNGTMYVTSGSALYQYSRDGKMVKKLFESTGVDKVAVADDGSKIYVTDQNANALITLDDKGNRLAEFKEDGLKNPWGVCVTPNSSLLVSYGTGDTVVQISADGKRKLATLARRQDGVDRPRSLTFDRRTTQLLVGQWSNDTSLLVLKVK